MRIINIIDRFDKVNYGIWNAAIATSNILSTQYGVKSELWYPVTDFNEALDIQCVELDLKTDTVKAFIKKRKLDPKNDLIVTHGCWQYPTRWGFSFKKLGFKWVYVPHGMLEPWSMHQKWLQKKLYFSFIEARYAANADIVRAVGKPEFINLKHTFKQVRLIPNCTDVSDFKQKNWESKCIQFLFMARLHYKKGIIPLVQSWKQSQLFNDSKFKLIIAGPDDGELNNLKREINYAKNIEYVGAVYGEQKLELLHNSHFYILPSFSEGFPTSVVEAMQFGLIPIITEGCNFPEVFENNLGIKISTKIDDIVSCLNSIDVNIQNVALLSKKCHLFIKENYSVSNIAEQQYQVYKRLLEGF